MKKGCLVLFTDYFPFGISSENAFLDPELPNLTKYFDIIIVPRLINNELDVARGNFVIDQGLANSLLKQKRVINFLWAALRSIFVWREIIMIVRLRDKFIPRIMASLSVFAYATAVSDWLTGFIEQHNIDIHNTVFYSYWFSKVTLGIGFIKKKI